MFETFAAHEDVGWFSNWFDRCPKAPLISVLSRLADFEWFRGHKKQDFQKTPTRRFQVIPEETYVIWEVYGRKSFTSDYLLDVEATDEEKQRLRGLVAKVLTYHGKKRFANKLTGPLRISYLNSVFPDALFVHIIRDGRAVVHSLMHVDFWKEKSGFAKPFWDNGLSEKYLCEWEKYDRSPLALAAVQWRNVIELGRKESDRLSRDQYLEIRYEDFVLDPGDATQKLNAFCSLSPSETQRQYLATQVGVKDMNTKYLEAFKRDELVMLNDIMKDLLREFDYPV